MATVAGIKINTKAKKVRDPLFMDEKYTGGEPKWPEGNEDWDQEKFDNFLRRSFYYYNYYYSQKNTKSELVDWAKTTEKYSKEEIKALVRAGDKDIPMTAHSLIMATHAGMKLRERHVDFLHECIAKAVAGAEPEAIEVKVDEKVKAYVPTIQDRLNEKTSEIIGELEGIFDDIATGVKNPTKLYEFLVSNNVVQSQLGKYEGLFTKRKAEIVAAMGKEDAQLKEGYSHLKATDFKRIIAWLDDLLNAVEQYRVVKKATKKARVKKAPTKEKLAAKLKYCKTDAGLKIVSINPADIIGASELWVYNIKTRKLGKYVAAAYKQLAIKGTSIENFDTDKSVSKTLRKPDEKLKEFAKAGKIQLRKFLEEIKATETKMNGRINADIVLLRTA